MNLLAVVCLFAAISMVTAAVDCEDQPRRTNWRSCCPHEKIIPRSVRHKCKASVMRELTNSTHRHVANACLLECYVSGIKVMNGDAVNLSELNKYLGSGVVKTKALVPVMRAAFVKCSKKLTEVHENMKKNPPNFPPHGRGECKACAGALLNCIKMEIIFNCPASLWKNSEKCNAHRKFYKACIPSVWPHMH